MMGKSCHPVMFQSPPTRSYGFPMVFPWFSHGFPTVPVTTNQLCMAPTRSPRYPSPSPSPWIPVSCKAGHCCTRSCAVAWIFLRETTAFYHLRPGLFLQICQTKKKSWDHWDKLGRHQVLWLIDMLI
jgi:hypothetical protein